MREINQFLEKYGQENVKHVRTYNRRCYYENTVIGFYCSVDIYDNGEIIATPTILKCFQVGCILNIQLINIMKSESELIDIATWHIDDTVANEAMKELRERFDSTYFWCTDCDGLVVKEKDCCLNRKESDLSDEDIIF